MQNLAGNIKCDNIIKKELKEADIETIYCNSKGEVPYSIEGRYKHYFFKRAWIYWVITGITSLRIALKLYKRSTEIEKGYYGYPIRVNGNSSCPKPTRKVNIFHIDTQEGLNEFIKIIEKG
jgi:hypothetical protein